MTVIASVESAAIELPLDAPISLSSRRVAGRHYALVRVTDSDGATGIGFCYAGHTGSTIIAEAVRTLLNPILVGEDGREVERLWQLMSASTLLLGRAGVVTRAISAVDIALWDLRARRAGVPLWQCLGSRKDPVPAYASGGYYLDGKGLDGLAAEVSAWVEQGFDRVKIKVGKYAAREEAERVRVAREALGPGGELMLDANNAWRSVDECVEFLRRIEHFAPHWIEEPFGPGAITAHARLVGRTPVLVATGEIASNVGEFERIIVDRAADILQPDAAVCGGITEFLRVAALAEASGVSLAPHWFDSVHVHLVAALPIARYVEFFTDDSIFNFRRLIDHRLEVRNGALALPGRAGLGFDFDPAVVTRYAVQEWA
jgi:L-alanine-DL-glutamate epimerase-like enolase superfamily enzyme